MRALRSEGLPFLLAILWPLVLLAPYFLSGFLLIGDLRDVFLPLEDFYRRSLGAGALPVWDARSALGFPALASAQIGFWYPPLLALRLLPPEPAMAIAYLFHGVLLSSGMFFYVRSLGRSRPAALLAAVALTGSGFVLGHLPHANILFAVAWLPWALLLADRLARTLAPRVGVLLATVLALTALPGHFQITFLTAVLASARFLTLLRRHQTGVRWSHTLWTVLLLLPLIGVGVALLSAAQLLPTLELMRESSRGAGAGFDLARANQHSFPPWQVVSFLIPAFFGFPELSEYWGKPPLVEMSAWIGAIPLLLALVGAVRGMTNDETRMTNEYPNVPMIETDVHAAGRHSDSGTFRHSFIHSSFVIRHFWTAAAVIGFLLAFGSWSPFRLLGIEPTLGIFSAPARWLLLTHFALALLAGTGLDRVRSVDPTRPRDRRGPARRVGSLGLLAALLVLGAFASLRGVPDGARNLGSAAANALVVGKPGHVLAPEAYAEKVSWLLERVGSWGVNAGNPIILVSLGALAVGSVLLLCGRMPVVLVLGLTLGELLFVGWRVHPRLPWAEVYRPSPAVETLREKLPGRVLVLHPPSDSGLLFANPVTKNRDGHERLLRDLAVPNILTRGGLSTIEWPAALDLAEAATVLAHIRDEGGRPVAPEILDRLGVRYVVGSSRTPALSVPDGHALTTFQSGDGHTVTVWERATARPRAEMLSAHPSSLTDPLPASAGTAEVTTDLGHRVRVAARNTSGREATLVLRDSFYPGWEAAVDRTPVTITRADTLFRAVSVPPGEHAVEFFYPARLAGIGMLVSGFSWFVVGVALLRRRG